MVWKTRQKRQRALVYRSMKRCVDTRPAQTSFLLKEWVEIFLSNHRRLVEANCRNRYGASSFDLGQIANSVIALLLASVISGGEAEAGRAAVQQSWKRNLHQIAKQMVHFND